MLWAAPPGSGQQSGADVPEIAAIPPSSSASFTEEKGGAGAGGRLIHPS